VKAEELAVLEPHELSDRLKASRRELYELRFQVAVGQLENNRQIRKVKKDIARILTVIRSRELAAFAAPVAVGAGVQAAVGVSPAEPEMSPAEPDAEAAAGDTEDVDE
jgi:large subunit ribosomal protein L29